MKKPTKKVVALVLAASLAATAVRASNSNADVYLDYGNGQGINIVAPVNLPPINLPFTVLVVLLLLGAANSNSTTATATPTANGGSTSGSAGTSGGAATTTSTSNRTPDGYYSTDPNDDFYPKKINGKTIWKKRPHAVTGEGIYFTDEAIDNYDKSAYDINYPDQLVMTKSLPQLRAEILDAVNQARRAAGLGAVQYSDRMNFIAQDWINGSYEGRPGYAIGHNPNWNFNENYMTGDPNRDGYSIVEGWMQSAPHRANILALKVKYIGFGRGVGTMGADFILDLWETPYPNKR
ncbi:MAG: CAP domain-containing protein [Corynebacterium sp.]|nr:CAP domain-containing protein [Corynebacterium sp.]